MAGRRLDGLERLARVQETRRSLAEWRLAGLRRRMVEAEATRGALIGSLNADEPMHGRFVDAMARHLARVDGEAERIGSAIVVASSALLAETGRLRQAARMLAGERAVQRREADKTALLDLVDLASASQP